MTAHPIATDIEGHYAYHRLVAAYFEARMEGQDQQREQDLRDAIELCLPRYWAMRLATLHRLTGGR